MGTEDDVQGRLLRAAREVLGRDGLDAPVDRVLEQAGLTSADVGDPVPDGPGLVRACWDDLVANVARAIAGHEDPATAFFAALSLTARQYADNEPFVSRLLQGGLDEPSLQPLVDHWLEVIAPTVADAQDAGLVRRDIDEADLVMLVDMLGAAARRGGTPMQERALRFIEDALDPRSGPTRL